MYGTAQRALHVEGNALTDTQARPVVGSGACCKLTHVHEGVNAADDVAGVI